jgi:hemerythrin-like metal-binding protein
MRVNATRARETKMECSLLPAAGARLSMKQIIWSNEIALDIPAMDRSHQIVFGELSQLATLPDRKFRPRFAAMIAGMECEFFSEDEWMERIDYPETQSHREQHAIGLGALHHAHSKVMAGEIELGRMVVASLSAWLIEHITTMDVPLALAVRRAGFP